MIGGARLVDGCEVRIAGLVSCFTYNNTRSAVQRVGPRWSLARVCKNGLLWNWFRLTDLRPPFARYLCYARRGARSRPAARRPASEARWIGEGGCRRRRQEPSSVTSTSANSSPSSCLLTRRSCTNSPPSPYPARQRCALHREHGQTYIYACATPAWAWRTGRRNYKAAKRRLYRKVFSCKQDVVEAGRRGSVAVDPDDPDYDPGPPPPPPNALVRYISNCLDPPERPVKKYLEDGSVYVTKTNTKRGGVPRRGRGGQGWGQSVVVCVV